MRIKRLISIITSVTMVAIISYADFITPATAANTTNTSWTANLTIAGSGKMINGYGRKKENTTPVHIYYDSGITNQSIDVMIYGSDSVNGTYIDLTYGDIFYTINYKTSRNCPNQVYQTFASSAYAKFKVFCGYNTGTFTGTWRPDNS